jgi:hypothetical protein
LNAVNGYIGFVNGKEKIINNIQRDGLCCLAKVKNVLWTHYYLFFFSRVFVCVVSATETIIFLMCLFFSGLRCVVLMKIEIDIKIVYHTHCIDNETKKKSMRNCWTNSKVFFWNNWLCAGISDKIGRQGKTILMKRLIMTHYFLF